MAKDTFVYKKKLKPAEREAFGLEEYLYGLVYLWYYTQ